VPARNALVGDVEGVVLVGDCNRRHQPAALGGAVTGIDVDMTRPQAAWAMVGVSVALDRYPTVATSEVLDAPDETFAHRREKPRNARCARARWSAAATLKDAV